MSRTLKNVPCCTGWLQEMGLIVATIKHFSFGLEQPHLDEWDCIVTFNKLLCEMNKFFNNLLDRHEILT